MALTSGQLPVGAAGRLAGTPERPAWPRHRARLPHVRCQGGSPLLALLVWFLYHVDFPTREPSTLRFHLILLPRGGAERRWLPRLHQPRAQGQRRIRWAQEMCSRGLLCAGPWAEGGGDSVTEGSLPPDWLRTSNLEYSTSASPTPRTRSPFSSLVTLWSAVGPSRPEGQEGALLFALLCPECVSTARPRRTSHLCPSSSCSCFSRELPLRTAAFCTCARPPPHPRVSVCDTSCVSAQSRTASRVSAETRSWLGSKILVPVPAFPPKLSDLGQLILFL